MLCLSKSTRDRGSHHGSLVMLNISDRLIFRDPSTDQGSPGKIKEDNQITTFIIVTSSSTDGEKPS